MILDRIHGDYVSHMDKNGEDRFLGGEFYVFTV